MTDRRSFLLVIFCVVLSSLVAVPGCNDSGSDKPDFSASTIVINQVGVGRYTVEGTLVNSGSAEARNISLTVVFFLDGQRVGSDTRGVGSLDSGDSMRVAYVIEDGPPNSDGSTYAIEWEYDRF